MSSLIYRLGYGIFGLVDADSANRLLNNQMYDTEEWREDLPANFINSFSYKGVAVAGSATASSVWNVIRITYDNNGNMSRIQYRSNIVWDNRTSGWSV